MTRNAWRVAQYEGFDHIHWWVGNAKQAGRCTGARVAPPARFSCATPFRAQIVGGGDLSGCAVARGWLTARLPVPSPFAADWYVARFGFTRVAYRGLETGCRNYASHVVRQGTVRCARPGCVSPSEVWVQRPRVLVRAPGVPPFPVPVADLVRVLLAPRRGEYAGAGPKHERGPDEARGWGEGRCVCGGRRAGHLHGGCGARRDGRA